MPAMWKTQCPLSVLQQRAFLLSKIREFFNKKNVLEVETPILSSAGNTDTNIESFTAENINSDFPMSYLRTSPEFPLKRLLCSGIGDVFELAKVFRKGEYSKTHNCEFTLLEWYRLKFRYYDLIQEVIELLSYLLCAFQIEVPETEILTFKQCFKNQLNINIFNVGTDTLNNKCEEFDYSGSYLDRDEALDYLFATQIQPNFDNNKFTFVTDYPASQAALAEINSENIKTALRFEVFYKGQELGNGYQELTDANELLKRFHRDNKKRKLTHSKAIRVDHNLIDAMNEGMPKCSGIAIGIDRLLMVLLEKKSIHEVMPFNAINS